MEIIGDVFISSFYFYFYAWFKKNTYYTLLFHLKTNNSIFSSWVKLLASPTPANSWKGALVFGGAHAMGPPGFCEGEVPGRGPERQPLGRADPTDNLGGAQAWAYSTGSIHHTQLGRKIDQSTSFPTQSWPPLAQGITGNVAWHYMSGCCGNRSTASKHEWPVFRKVPLMSWPHSRVSNAIPSDSAPQIDSVQRIMRVAPHCRSCRQSFGKSSRESPNPHKPCFWKDCNHPLHSLFCGTDLRTLCTKSPGCRGSQQMSKWCSSWSPGLTCHPCHRHFSVFLHQAHATPSGLEKQREKCFSPSQDTRTPALLSFIL